MTVHAWWVKSQILPLFEQGKCLEIRTAVPFFAGIITGDILVLNSRLRRQISAIRRYDSFESMLDEEEPDQIFPGKNADEVEGLLRSIYTREQERRGVIVFELLKVA